MKNLIKIKGQCRDTFAGDARGTTALVFALSFLPIMILVGLTFDTGRLQSAKSVLSTSLDASAIAGVRALINPANDDAAVLGAAQATFRANVEDRRSNHQLQS